MRYAPLLLLLGACAFQPQDAVPFNPPVSFRVVWDSAQACTGRRGRFEDLHFFTVEPGGIDGDVHTVGRTEGHDIYLDTSVQYSGLAVKHEMIHALGVHGHPVHPFNDPCHAMYDDYVGPQLLER